MDINFNLTAPLILGVGLSLICGVILAVLNIFVKKKPAAKPESKEGIIKRPVILCSGISGITPVESEYQGHPSCKAAKLLYGGPKACKYGCIGLGDCAKVCPEQAISTCNGLAVIDRNKCSGCGLCKDACPQKLITFLPKSQLTVVACNSRDKDEMRLELCNTSCINCGACARVCRFDAVVLGGKVARIDPNKCVNCGECKKVCPQHCIQVVTNEAQ